MSAEEEKYGIEVERRDRILRTLVRNLFTYHQQEILLTVLNEYTDWTRPFPPHPLSILDCEYTIQEQRESPRKSFFHKFPQKNIVRRRLAVCLSELNVGLDRMNSSLLRSPNPRHPADNPDAEHLISQRTYQKRNLS